MQVFDNLDNQVLSSFVDGQLDAETSESIIKEMDKNAEVRERVYKLRRAKDLLRLGFGKACPPSSKHAKAEESRWQRYAIAMVASVAAISISLASAVSGYYFGKQEQININAVVQTATQQKSERILLHISESDTEHFAAVLDYAEKFLKEHEANGGQIAVVANAGGLDLMRAGISPYEKQIRNMMNEHENVYFIACANSVRILQEKGIKLNLIDNVQVDQPAMDHIIDYVRDGWTYKKVNSLIKI